MNGGLKHFLKVLELLLCGWMKEKMVKQPVPSDIGKHVLTVSSFKGEGIKEKTLNI